MPPAGDQVGHRWCPAAEKAFSPAVRLCLSGAVDPVARMARPTEMPKSMEKKPRFLAISIATLVVVVVGMRFYLGAPRGREPGPPEKENESTFRGKEAWIGSGSPGEAMERILSSEIIFYGQVVDQNGDPVADARVRYYYDGKKTSPGVAGNDFVKTSPDGTFKVDGVTGSRLSVAAEKEGFDHVSDRGDGVSSTRNFDFGVAEDGGRRYMDPTTPTKLTLIKMGELEALIHGERMHHPLSPNGEVVRIALDQAGTAHVVDFELKVDPAAAPLGGDKERYAWSASIRVPEGGIVEQRGPGYTAPKNGYEKELRLGYSESQLTDHWRPVASPKAFFVRFDDGTHAFLKLDLYAKSRKNCLSLESWFNPKPESRQLAPGKGSTFRRKGVLVSGTE